MEIESAAMAVSYTHLDVYKRQVVDIAPFHDFEDKIPKELMDQVLAKKDAIISGEFEVPRIESVTK